MIKYFVMSDLHSYFTIAMMALNNMGFDENNPNHKVIICGDAFDRGNESAKMLEWIIDMIKRDKLIYIKGNHEILMQDMLKRGFPLWHDEYNGTEKTFVQLSNAYIENPGADDPNIVVKKALQPLYDNMVNYYVTKKYVFVHGFLPVFRNEDGLYRINKQWKRANQKRWNDAMWLNSMDMVINNGLHLKDKTIVAGHFHTSWARYMFDYEPEFGEGSDFSPYCYKDWLIAIDACTAHTGEVNCIVIEDEPEG